MDTVKAHFSPEWLNRLDDVVLFSPLGRAQLNMIMQLQLEDVGLQVRCQRGAAVCGAACAAVSTRQ
jgi:ATP-dependent Clp protease ATP-binding subunit ClpB